MTPCPRQSESISDRVRIAGSCDAVNRRYAGGFGSWSMMTFG
jgi:hypothetical protein